MSDDYGLIIAQDGKAITDVPLKFSSSQRHLTVDMEAKPVHMDIVDLNGGTAYPDINDPFNASHTYQETLFPIAHKLGFTPLVNAYFYVLASTVIADSRLQSYAHNGLILSGASGTVQDSISFEADSTEVRIIHRLDTFGANTTYVSDADKLTIRVKYYISPIDIGMALYKYLGPSY